MKKTGPSFQLSATDLVGYLNCQHLSGLDCAVAEGALAKPKVWDPLLQILWERGSIHEQNYVTHLEQAGLDVVRIDGVDITDDAVKDTLAAMKLGTAIIVQGALSYNGWSGRADILRRVKKPSAIGDWSYEVIDTKLARETKAGTVLQLCLYSDLLTAAQGTAPEYMHVVAPWSDFEPQQYRFTDYAAYFRKVQHALRKSLSDQETEETYPDPKEHCLPIRLSPTPTICSVSPWTAGKGRRRRIEEAIRLILDCSENRTGV